MVSSEHRPAGEDGRHVPVLLAPVLDALSPRPGEEAVDATIGLAGHALALLERLAPGGRLLGIDRDPRIAGEAEVRLSAHAPSETRWQVIRGNAADLPDLLETAGWPPEFDLFLMDCGICSLHLDDPALGFSFLREGPLSMKLDPEASGPDAAALVNEADPALLKRLLTVYGEEPQARRIVDRIVEERKARRIATTTELADLVHQAYPARFRGGRRHPATRTFQALRIAVNDEIGSLARALREALTMLRIGGRAAFITFHSLEARLVKQTLRAATEPSFPTHEDFLKGRGTRPLELSKRIEADPTEIDRNPRARSAELRACRKVSPLKDPIEWPKPPIIDLSPR